MAPAPATVTRPVTQWVTVTRRPSDGDRRGALERRSGPAAAALRSGPPAAAGPRRRRHRATEAAGCQAATTVDLPFHSTVDLSIFTRFYKGQKNRIVGGENSDPSNKLYIVGNDNRTSWLFIWTIKCQ